MISIIIPTFNEEKLISQTLKQFMPYRKKYGLQIIVTDDNSTDNTVNIAEKYADLVVLNEGKRGVSANRNYGSKFAIGDVLVFFDADTKVKNMNLFFKKVIKFFKNKNNVGSYVKIQGLPQERNFRDILLHEFYYSYVSFLDMLKIPIAGGQCHIVRRKLFDKVKYDEKLNAGEDIDMILRLKNFGNVRLIKGPVVFESTRRYKQLGYARTLFYWILNSFYVMFFKKPYLKKWEVIR